MSYPMLGTRIVIDEEKVLREGEYDLDKMYALIDKLAKDSGMIKKDKHTFVCKGDENDLSCLGIFTLVNLVECAWFTKSVKEWLWLSEKEGNSDFKLRLKAENMGVWQ